MRFCRVCAARITWKPAATFRGIRSRLVEAWTVNYVRVVTHLALEKHLGLSGNVVSCAIRCNALRQHRYSLLASSLINKRNVTFEGRAEFTVSAEYTIN